VAQTRVKKQSKKMRRQLGEYVIGKEFKTDIHFILALMDDALLS